MSDFVRALAGDPSGWNTKTARSERTGPWARLLKVPRGVRSSLQRVPSGRRIARSHGESRRPRPLSSAEDGQGRRQLRLHRLRARKPRSGWAAARAAASGTRSRKSPSRAERRRFRGSDGRRRAARGARRARPCPLAEVEALAVERVLTGSGELDRVLGGGIVPGLDRADRRLARDREEHADERRARPRAGSGADRST